uniref:Odorant receptor n=1 Tax=Histia rhodope TaxID=1453155 RepID=A0A7G4KBT5_9NEOP|nr:odorant receptor [Histia rhodope]
MRNKIVSYLENEEHPLLGPTLWGLRAWGLYPPINSNWYTIISCSVHLAAIAFVVTQYIELWLIRFNLNLAMRNLSITMLSSICVIKAGTFVLWREDWMKIINFVSSLEKTQLSETYAIKNNIISRYTKYSRCVTYIYWGLVTATVFTVVMAPLAIFLSSPSTNELMRNGTIPYPEIMSSWTPFDRTRGYGYWACVVEHMLICFYGGGIVANYDSNAVVLMSFFAGQLKLLSANCTMLFGDENEVVSYNEALRRIRDCHYHHVQLVKYAKILNSLLSPVLFLYVIICSLMICASAIQLTTEGTTSMQRIWIAEYLMALIAQLFLYCWHGNEVLFMSEKVDDGIYTSTWYLQNNVLRRNVLLLRGQLRKRIIFTAGPFTTLTIAAFVGILKGSYSYYTILNKRDD